MDDIEFWMKMSQRVMWTMVLFTLNIFIVYLFMCAYKRTQVNRIIRRLVFAAIDKIFSMFKFECLKWILF